MLFAPLSLLGYLLILVAADPTPTGPDSTSVFNQGSNCSFTWDVDPSGVWTTMNVELMCGDNFNMVHMSTVATVNGADPTVTSFSYPCLEVTPWAPIYFYQFTSPASAATYWTTRFTLAGPNGETVPAPNKTQPGSGAPTPWGVGELVDPSQATPAPVKGVSSAPASGAPTIAAPVPSSPGAISQSSTPSPTQTGAPTSSPPSSTSSSSSNTTSPIPSSSSSANIVLPLFTLGTAYSAPILALLYFL